MMQFLLAVCLFSAQAAAIFPFSDPRILFGSGSHFGSLAGFPWNRNPFVTNNSFSGVSSFNRNGLYSSSSSFNENPCTRLTCGFNADCTKRSSWAVCTCRSGYEGNPYSYCRRSECVENLECPSDKICYKNKCINPCISRLCGVGANCTVKNHVTYCQCPQGSVGDPFTSCVPQSSPPSSGSSQGSGGLTDFCNPTPCGVNTKCHVENSTAVCSCLDGWIGNPIEGCRRECESDVECSAVHTCIGFRCKDPCESCGIYAKCEVRNHRAICSCPTNYLGDPFIRCYPECTTHDECRSNQTCSNLKCVDHCESCGIYAKCEVRNHRPICSCPANFLGDPFIRCYPECTTHDECRGNQACSNLKCVDSCIGACGIGADCRVENHQAICSCPAGTTGHPFDRCRPSDLNDLCNPNPCGLDADCKPGKDESGNDQPVCYCRAGYLGNPLVSCLRGQCIDHADCNGNQACFSYQCVDPCTSSSGSGVCGVGARCDTRNHVAVCTCPIETDGDPLSECRTSLNQD